MTRISILICTFWVAACQDTQVAQDPLDASIGSCVKDSMSCARQLNEPIVRQYKSWRLFPGTKYLQANTRTPMHGAFVSIHVNDIAYDYSQQLRDISRVQYPVGSIVVKENSISAKGGSAEPWITVMVKLKDFCGDPNSIEPHCAGGNWFFYRLRFGKIEPGAGKPATQCIDCHGPAQKGDYLWSAFDIKAAQAVPLPSGSISINGTNESGCSDVSLNASVPPDIFQAPNTDLQAEFDCLSWRSFVALNFPNKPPSTNSPWRGESDPTRTITAPGPRVWETFPTTFDTFQPSNSRWTLDNKNWQTAVDNAGYCNQDHNVASHSKILIMTAKNRVSSILDETHEAFGNPLNSLVDQNGKQVLYEIRLNRDEWESIRQNKYADTGNYSTGGPIEQLNWSARPVQLPDNTTGATGVGAVEVKAAWRQMCTDPNACNKVDQLDRYYVREAMFYDRTTRSCSQVTVGLVGMHIVHKTYTAPQWVWSTFEHVDNVPAVGAPPTNVSFSFYNASLTPLRPDALACQTQRPGLFTADGPGKPIPNGVACPNIQSFDNVVPADTLTPVQVTRIDAISSSSLNNRFPQLLETAGSPFKNYRLVNTQWPMNGRDGNGRINQHPCDTDDSGKNCYQVMPLPGSPGHRLRNTSMETYQVSYTNPNPKSDPPRSLAGQYSSAGCIQCHSSGVDFSFIWTDAIEEPVPNESAN